jgi:hypothetical protein
MFGVEILKDRNAKSQKNIISVKNTSNHLGEIRKYYLPSYLPISLYLKKHFLIALNCVSSKN